MSYLTQPLRRYAKGVRRPHNYQNRPRCGRDDEQDQNGTQGARVASPTAKSGATECVRCRNLLPPKQESPRALPTSKAGRLQASRDGGRVGSQVQSRIRDPNLQREWIGGWSFDHEEDAHIFAPTSPPYPNSGAWRETRVSNLFCLHTLHADPCGPRPVIPRVKRYSSTSY